MAVGPDAGTWEHPYAGGVPAAGLTRDERAGGRYVERTTVLAGATTSLDEPFPVEIDPAGLTRQ
ncbi:hypothetical protein [Streptomyces sp. NPDC048332]|uniref:hypothetical protein n=1 Tax=Streptomyces sp. NPDC048332 TaxID=3154619 RepID=UPI003426A68C